MFDIGWGELLVIGVVALIAIGPKELPGVLHNGRQLASDFRETMQKMMHPFAYDAREMNFWLSIILGFLVALLIGLALGKWTWVQ
jgi:Tat protein translocase TatB subunit